MTAHRNINAVERVAALTLFVFGVVVGIVGWLVWDRNPDRLVRLLWLVVAALGVGQVSAVGKRFTWKKEHNGEVE